MARDNESTTIHAPDFEKMKRIFTRDIRPAEEKNAKVRGDLSAAWKAIEDDCHCNKRAAKQLHKLFNMSEEERDDFLRTLYGGMAAMGIGISADLVDRMGDGEAPTMPIVDGNGLGADSLATAH
jgi:truncated hemoglobin YjbI